MRVRRKSIGGISETSADVHTATTPAIASAALASIDMIRPCAWPERTTRMCSMRGKAISAAKAPRPVTNGRSSRRVPERPTKLMSLLARSVSVCWLLSQDSPPFVPARGTPRRSRRGDPVAGTQCLEANTLSFIWRAGGAQRGPNALRRRRNLVDGDAERGEGIVDGIDDRRRRADGAALAQPLCLGDGRLRHGLEMMDLDRRDFPRGRRQIIRQARRENIAGVIVDDLLEQRVGDALGNAAVDLPVDDHRIDQTSGIFGNQKLFDHDAAGLHVDLDQGDVAGIGKRSRWIIGCALDDTWSDLAFETMRLMIGGARQRRDRDGTIGSGHARGIGFEHDVVR